jgi:hypothetical protein
MEPVQHTASPLPPVEHDLAPEVAPSRLPAGVRRFETLHEQLRFEQFLADFAVRFQNLPPEQVDQEIVRSLEALCEVLGVERAGLALFSAPASRY